MNGEKKRRISGRKVLQALVTLVVTTGCTVAILGASGIHETRTVQRMDVHIDNKRSCGFLDEPQVRDMLVGSRHIRLEQTPMSMLDLRSMESILLANPWVADAEVYVDNARVLHVHVRQRVPAYRVFDKEGNSYYVDDQVSVLPLSEYYTHYAPVVTNVPVLRDDSAGHALRAQIYHVVSAISRDTFWRAQVTEIKLADDTTFELVPVLGAHRILLGDTSRVEQKLNNVFAFYRQVLNRIGWDKYQVINAAYRDQVVASPSLPWKAPKDKALSNMNWVKSIMGSAPPDNSYKDSTAGAERCNSVRQCAEDRIFGADRCSSDSRRAQVCIVSSGRRGNTFQPGEDSRTSRYRTTGRGR
jgi:cell division protein FtsQ